MPDSRLYQIADSILDALANGLNDAGIPVPDRQYIHSGEVAYDLIGDDCADQLVVTFVAILQGAGDQAGYIPGTVIKCAVPLIAQFDVHLVRCVPTIDENTGDAPSAEALTTSALDILYDAMTLPAVAISKGLQGELTDRQCSLAGLGNVLPIGPAGAAGGTVLSLYVELV